MKTSFSSTNLADHPKLMPIAVRVLSRAAKLGLPVQPTLRRLALRRVLPAIEGVSGAERSLKPLTKSMEARFLESGNELETLTSSAEALLSNAEELVELATGKDDAERVIGETMSVLDSPLMFLDRCVEAMQNQVNAVCECNDGIARLLDCERKLQDAVAPLRATQTMFRVEAARLTENAREAFASLTDQIEELHDQVRDSFRMQFQQLTGARLVLSEVSEKLARGVKAQRETLAEKRASISGALQKLTHEIERNSEREIELTSKSRAVSQAVGKIVVALQSQDIVAQRVEHVIEALSGARAEAVGLERATGADTGSGACGRIRVLSELQSGQIAGIRDEVDKVSRAVASAADEILSTVKVIDSECVLLNEFSEVTAAGNGTIQVLLDIVEDVERLVNRSIQLVAESRDLIQPVKEVAGRLTGSVELLSHQMNLVALNAQIQAVQIGAGTGLEVLAAHTASIATATTELGSAISKDLEALRESLTGQMSAFLEFVELGRQQKEYMAHSGEAHQAKLHEIRNGTLAKMHTVGECVTKVRESTLRIAGSVRLQDGEGEKFSEIASKLAALSHSLSAVYPDSEGAELNELEGQYTMASERENHRAVLSRMKQGGAEAPDGVPLEGPAVGSEGADAGSDGIELF